jgi:hypothetical protein
VLTLWTGTSTKTRFESPKGAPCYVYIVRVDNVCVEIVIARNEIPWALMQQVFWLCLFAISNKSFTTAKVSVTRINLASVKIKMLNIRISKTSRGNMYRTDIIPIPQPLTSGGF